MVSNLPGVVVAFLSAWTGWLLTPVVPLSFPSCRFGASHVCWLVWRLSRVLSAALSVEGSLGKTLFFLFLQGAGGNSICGVYMEASKLCMSES